MVLLRQNALTQHDLNPGVLRKQLVRRAEHPAGLAKQLDSMPQRGRNTHLAARAPEERVHTLGDVIVKDDEVPDVLDLRAHLHVELIDVRLLNARAWKHLQQSDDAALDQMNAR